MPNNSDAKKKKTRSHTKNIQIPPIPKQTAGAVAGAAAGSIAGPIGAVVGGVVGGIFAGKAAEKRRPIAPAAKRTVRSVIKRSKAISKAPRRRRSSRKSVAKSRKARARSRGKTKKTVSRRSTTTKSRKGLGTRRRSTFVAGCPETLWAVAANGISRSIRERLAAGPAKAAFRRSFYSGRFRSKTIHKRKRAELSGVLEAKISFPMKAVRRHTSPLGGFLFHAAITIL